MDDAVYVGDIQGDYDASMDAGVKFIHAAYGFGTIEDKVPEIHTNSVNWRTWQIRFCSR